MFLQLLQSTNRKLPKLYVCVSRRIRVRGDPQGSTQQQGQPAWPADAHIHPPGPPAQCVHRGGHASLRSHHRHHNGETRHSCAVSNAFLPSCKSILHYIPGILHNDTEWKPRTSIAVRVNSDYRHYPDTSYKFLCLSSPDVKLFHETDPFLQTSHLTKHFPLYFFKYSANRKTLQTVVTTCIDPSYNVLICSCRELCFEKSQLYSVNLMWSRY